MARPCQLCSAYPGTEQRESKKVCISCARHLDSMSWDAALKELRTRGER